MEAVTEYQERTRCDPKDGEKCLARLKWVHPEGDPWLSTQPLDMLIKKKKNNEFLNTCFMYFVSSIIYLSIYGCIKIDNSSRHISAIAEPLKLIFSNIKYQNNLCKFR